jgi:RNA polymerase sigma-70 factor (ECF subfamily)
VNEHQCLERIRQGGKQRAEAISQLYRQCAHRFLAYFQKHRVPGNDAEDLVQEVFVKVVRRCEEFRGEARIEAWMWRIARNCLIDYFRRARPEDPVDEDELIRLVGSDKNPGPLKSDGLEDCVRVAFAEFAQAHPDRAEVLRLIAFEGWDIAEVAAMLNRTSGATREYLSQCRKRLQVFLEPCRQYLTD